MRLLELRTDDAAGPALEFHPNLTVVSGLSPTARAAVLRAVEALPGGTDPGLGGLVEAHGVIFDLTTETLDILGLDSPRDVVVRSDAMADVGPVAPAAPEATGGSGGTVDPVELERARTELERALAAERDANEGLALMHEALERARLERAAAVEATGRIQSALDKARRERDVARAQRDGKVDASLGAPSDEDRARREVEELQRTQVELEEAIAELEERDPRPVQVLVDALDQPVSDRLVPSQEAAALADEFAELQRQLDEVERRLQSDGLSMDQLSQQLEDARFEVAQAERAVQKPEVTDQDVVELEAAHEEVLEAERRASGRVGRKAALKRMEEAKEREQVILDRIGFPTWAAYVMGSSLLNIDPMAEARLEQARRELEQAEAAWADLTQQLEADPDYSGLLDRLEAVFLAAFDILGGETEGDLESRLRNHLVPDEEVSHDDLLEALAYQLSLRGVEVEEGATDDVVVGLAEQWLAATGDHWEKYRALQEEHVRVGDALAVAERELEVLSGEAEEDTPEARQQAYETAEARVAEILADLEQANEIVAELDGQVEAREMLLTPSEMSLTAAVTAREAAEAALAELEAQAGAAPRAGAGGATSRAAAYVQPSYDRKPEIYDDLPYAGDDDEDEDDDAPDEDDVEFYFLARMAALRSVSHAGSVPLVVDDALAGLPGAEAAQVLAKLERMSEQVQVIYLTDDTELVDWADRAGIQRAAAVTPQAELA